MKLRRVRAVARKEFLHVLRDPLSLGMAVAIPALMLVLFGYALTLDVDNVPLVVWDQSRTDTSRDFIAAFTGSRYFKMQQYADSYRQVERAIDRGQALAALVIPTDFARAIQTGRTAEAQLIVDGSDSNTATIAIGYADVVTRTWSQQAVLTHDVRATGRTQAAPVDFRPRVWFNTDLESKNYIIPGLIAVIMMIIAALLTSLTVAREWDRGTMEQLIATPVQAGELILGKLLPYFAIGMVDVLVAVLMGRFVFSVPLRGSAALLIGVSAVFLVGVLCMGLLISIIARDQLVASQLAIITTFIPSYLLSGFIFAIPNMPHAIQVVTYFIPARYFIAILKGIYLKGIGLELLAWQFLLLVVFGAMTVAAAKLKLRKKLR
ncbi:MAG: ABC transporter permease [Phycisphaerae bacterium]